MVFGEAWEVLGLWEYLLLLLGVLLVLLLKPLLFHFLLYFHLHVQVYVYLHVYVQIHVHGAVSDLDHVTDKLAKAAFHHVHGLPWGKRMHRHVQGHHIGQKHA